MNILIASLYGMINALALVLYAMVAAPEWAVTAAHWMPATIAVSVFFILGVSAFIATIRKYVVRFLPNRKRSTRQRTRIAR